MKNTIYKYIKSPLLLGLLATLTIIACQREIEDLEPATFPVNPEVFIDGFSAGLQYAAFGGSKVTAFEVDKEVKYEGEASMRFAIPDDGDPEGGYAGGVFFTSVGRDMSEFDALTFWAKASKSATIDQIGFGNDLGEEKYKVSIQSLPVNTNWKKYFIPIPDASKLIEERGMLFYSEAPEEGKGYTFWLDQVQFEKVGRIAHPNPGILNGQDQNITTETGADLSVGGLFSTFNLPTGVDQRVEVAPAYFSFSSSDESVATVNEKGEVSVIDAGTTVITAKLGEIDAVGSMIVESTGEAVVPEKAAPTPEEDAENVISLFSNAYENVLIDTWDTGWEFSEADVIDIQIDGDDVKRYSDLNFVGIEFTSQTIDISGMNRFHIDIWTPNATDLPNAFKVLLIDFGANNTFDGGDDSSHELAFTSPTIASEEWISIDVPLSDFVGLVGRRNLAQMVLSGDLPTVFIDNVYFYNDGSGGGSGGEMPTTAAPSPTSDAADVISIFSDAYENVEGTDFFPNWGQATAVTQEEIEGNNTLVYTGLNYQGTQLASALDISEMEFLHLDYWTDNSSVLSTFLISEGPTEVAAALTVPTDGWASVDIPLGDFSPVNLAQLIQFKFEGNGNIYLDNIYFYKEGDDGSGELTPTMAAPTPMQDAANVISVFSDAYENVADSDLNPNWGQATVVTTEMIEGNNTLLYSGLNYQGLQLGSAQDVSSMEFLHLDFWTANSTALSTFLISGGPVETAYALTVPTNGWTSIDIPLNSFDPINLADVIQMKFEGNGDIYLDNIYFYTEGSGDPNVPNIAAPTPMDDAANVISIFSDAYDDIAGSDLNPNWGQATVVTTEEIEGNMTLLYSGLNYQGLQIGAPQNVAEMQFLHLDFWTNNSTALNVFLISGGPVETAYALDVPSSGWVSIDIPLSNFDPVNLADIIQFKFDGNGDIYLDNIYFKK